MENYFTIYKTTNLENGKIYIGYHETPDIFDNYLGSGSIIYLMKKMSRIFQYLQAEYDDVRREVQYGNNELFRASRMNISQ